ncbi:hypothetical protein EJ05DRAFT_441473 [Pseudovirgaria hyperparasitica]|uniref:SWIRM domain-containing protein n=1 Tax=Pseudovirgaria hyperparasitica TaxID=470096 RepID=A0A6A6W4X3_9PEZI|nr:uncharacterized protein EJ05DRAFT_441473 [Pseudovirgaria hyperparasitica]KAF2756607.1 hypothetical protein EJ05DRAFT_441473 [Pseudovirgaria hyperparasitica]
MSSREEGENTTTFANGDLPSDKNSTVNTQAWREGSHNGKTKTSPDTDADSATKLKSTPQSCPGSLKKLKLIVRESPLSKPEHPSDNDSPSYSTSSSNVAKRIKTSSTPEALNIHDVTQQGTPTTRAYHKKVVAELRPRSSIPTDLAPNDLAHELAVAAYSSRLNPYALHKGEYELFKDHITLPQVTIYLNIRNAILRLWTRNTLVQVTKEEALGCARESRYFKLAEVAYHWLIRRGLINYGCLELPNSAGPITRIKATGRRRTIIVIGAGVSGLGCARQLQGLFLQYGYRFTENGEKPPRVIVLEGRKRVGGRVYSHPLKKQGSDLLPNDLRCTAEMGAQIVTGFESGNPLKAMVRGQLALHCYPLKDNTILYDHDGVPIDRQHDIQVEGLFNDILERASAYRNKNPVVKTIEGDKKLLYWAKEPTSEGTKVISELDSSDAAVTVTGSRRPGQKNTTSTAGRGYILGDSEKTLKPAADAAKKLGWTLRPGVSESQSIDLDAFVKSKAYPTLGETMDEAIRQYQSLISLTPKELRLLNWHYANMEYANAANVNQLSLGNWDQDAGNEFEGQHCEIIGGYTQFPRGLYSLPSQLDVRFGSSVKRVQYEDNGGVDESRVTIECENGEVMEGDMAVVTTSLGVLKHGNVVFQPPLPGWKQGAIDRLGFGLLNKIILVFDEPFWEQDRDMFGLLNDVTDNVNEQDTKQYGKGRGKYYFFWNRTRQSGQHMLVALMAGDAAHEAEIKDDKSLVEGVLAKLRSMFDQRKVPKPRETIVSRWKSDPFVRGSYSYIGPQSVQGDYDAMAKSIGPLHFAGEATCGTHPATVHGAYLSGLRAASDVIDALLGPINVPTPLAPRKQKAEDAPAVAPLYSTPAKIPLLDAPLEMDTQLARAQQESYEASIIGAILQEIGDRPVQPKKGGTNPFLLYTKDYWVKCKADCDQARQRATGNPNAKADKLAIRNEVGRSWRTASEEVRRPYIEQTDSAKANAEAGTTAYKEQAAIWDREAARIRREYMEKNPMMACARTNGFSGKTAIESGRNGMR